MFISLLIKPVPRGDTLHKLYDPTNGPMKIVAFMSGSGTNLVKILEREEELMRERGTAPYHVEVIFSDNPKSRAVEIGSSFDRPVIVRDLESYCQRRDGRVRDPDLRLQFDYETIRSLRPFGASIAAYAGYMRKASPLLVSAFLGVNVHPADLTKMNGERRLYTGDRAVEAAIRAGEPHLRSSTHIVENRVDYGQLLMISPPLTVNPEDAESLRLGNDGVPGVYQNALKSVGDWLIFPHTLQWLAEGRYEIDARGVLHFDTLAVPGGLRLESPDDVEKLNNGRFER